MKEQYCFLNGQILPILEAKVSVLDIGLLRGYGIYDGIAGINGKPFRFADHWDRFVSGAHALSLNIPITQEKAERVVKELLDKNHGKDRANVRFILTGGETLGGIEYDFEKPTFYILTEKWEPLPQKLYTEGAKLITHRYLRDYPESKTIHYIKAVNLQEFKKGEGAVEILFTYDGEVLECATSNIFLVKDKTLITPSENILEGITKKAAIELASGKYEVEARPVAENELKTADEVFITSSFKDIVPVVKIDDFTVGSGVVGPMTKGLMEGFAKVLNMS